MRVSASTILLASALLVAFASASDVMKGRQLHLEKSESKSKPYYTDYFTQGEGYHGAHEAFIDGNLVGVIIGFIATGIFMIFAVVNLIIDEKQRHINFQKKVDNDISDLKLRGVDEATLQKWAKEFQEKEATRGQARDLEKERQELAEIN